MKDLIGKKVRGFKFESMKYNDLPYETEMDKHIGEIGEIIVEFKKEVRVLFTNASWYYPKSLIEQHLVEEESEQDNVNSPSHYTKGGIECIDAIEASMTREAFLGYLKGNVQKYVFRYESKSNPTEDLKKAQWYLNKLISKLES